MGKDDRDAEAGLLLELDGQVMVVDAKGEYCARFRVQRVEPSAERPHGLNYSLTLHGPHGQRILGFDNAHVVRRAAGPSGRKTGPADHRHKMDTVRPYRFTSAVRLLEDFWREVDRFLKEKGVI